MRVQHITGDDVEFSYDDQRDWWTVLRRRLVEQTRASLVDQVAPRHVARISRVRSERGGPASTPE
jgi:hypothetical protein